MKENPREEAHEDPKGHTEEVLVKENPVPCKDPLVNKESPQAELDKENPDHQEPSDTPVEMAEVEAATPPSPTFPAVTLMAEHT